jgi:NAD(P)-dependent dehydrogenase (short-subunit alcohol dehydrogenase family)
VIDTPVAVVTGGAGGLGSAIGRTLAADGFQVVLPAGIWPPRWQTTSARGSGGLMSW